MLSTYITRMLYRPLNNRLVERAENSKLLVCGREAPLCTIGSSPALHTCAVATHVNTDKYVTEPRKPLVLIACSTRASIRYHSLKHTYTPRTACSGTLFATLGRSTANPNPQASILRKTARVWRGQYTFLDQNKPTTRFLLPCVAPYLNRA